MPDNRGCGRATGWSEEHIAKELRAVLIASSVVAKIVGGETVALGVAALANQFEVPVGCVSDVAI